MIDPWAGSYMMESLTDRLIEEATVIIDEVRARACVRVSVTCACVVPACVRVCARTHVRACVRDMCACHVCVHEEIRLSDRKP